MTSDDKSEESWQLHVSFNSTWKMIFSCLRSMPKRWRNIWCCILDGMETSLSKVMSSLKISISNQKCKKQTEVAPNQGYENSPHVTFLGGVWKSNLRTADVYQRNDVCTTYLQHKNKTLLLLTIKIRLLGCLDTCQLPANQFYYHVPTHEDRNFESRLG